jgi:hypothetical protein
MHNSGDGREVRAGMACSACRHLDRAARPALVPLIPQGQSQLRFRRDLYLLLSTGPFVLAAAGLAHAAGRNADVIAREVVEHQHLTGDTANLVRETFGTASHNALASSIAGLVGFLLRGLGIGGIYQGVYAAPGAFGSGDWLTPPASRSGSLFSAAYSACSSPMREP